MKHLHLALSWRTETIKAIRHNLAPAEDRNTELATIRFAQAYLVVTFVIDPKPRLGAPTA
jgi:hypothetical protein